MLSLGFSLYNAYDNALSSAWCCIGFDSVSRNDRRDFFFFW
jgi:hypothetical protein